MGLDKAFWWRRGHRGSLSPGWLLLVISKFGTNTFLLGDQYVRIAFFVALVGHLFSGGHRNRLEVFTVACCVSTGNAVWNATAIACVPWYAHMIRACYRVPGAVRLMARNAGSGAKAKPKKVQV